MSAETVFTNARIVTEDRIVDGTLVIRDGKIAEISEGNVAEAEDFGGDLLIPGLVELHTDHLEGHYAPRPGVRWNKIAAIQAHDAQVAASGITTVFDCLRLGSDDTDGFEAGEMRAMADAIIQAEREDRLKAQHFLHLRCEVSAANVMEHFAAFEDEPHVRLASMMDHAPGQRQFADLQQYRRYYKPKRGLDDDAFERFVARRQAASEAYADKHRRMIADHCSKNGISIASHDDATTAHVDEAIALGVRIAEFPTSFDAARASHAAGLSVLMGAPNVVRGKSHSGNIAARDLAAAGVLDVLSSDYVPFSLLHAPFILAGDEEAGISLPQAIAMVTATPARAAGLADRGRIAEGLRADLVRVKRTEDVPVVRAVFSLGKRVA
ncbi:alpha-D-ribose 1-methylphosphonate 5-triphosphate diphosphatase [Martelella radicis]|uniref:Alpha-D-ribose 1-methylphosphonate 5-triphosphate diphosphatase n=1 Tax=Martelella radicis TaxID=1397476 RepID=A0A7W6PAQ7_9HYPH|nr:alpha-D-ribose 1-methylphosphonate 5-triphosphate diphosphatase [Martelella radicis]MBB4123115.1 alpha-D-ribose 1-methylphosphonate 5-triphosphate diphosphatase [Martelella radicis]